jgi:hypothetical protein
VTQLVRRGLSFPTYRTLPRAPYFTRPRLLRLEGAGEEEWTRDVKACGRVYTWLGFHTRDSDGIMESLHVERLDGFTEAKGVPDWYFWHEERHQHFWAELKGASGHLSGDQKREITSMRRGGETVFTWYPRDALEVERVFQYGLETN